MKVDRKRKYKLMVPIASMGDIAFLLIIFFVLTSQFMQEQNIEAKPPENPTIEEMEPIPISLIVDEDGQIYLNGNPIPVQMVEPGVSVLVQDAEDKRVMVKIHKDLPHKLYGEVMKGLSEAGARIVLVGRKTEAKL